MADFVAGRAIIRAQVDLTTARLAQKEVDKLLKSIQDSANGFKIFEGVPLLDPDKPLKAPKTQPLITELDRLKAEFTQLRGEAAKLDGDALQGAANSFQKLAEEARDLSPALEDDAKAFDKFERFAVQAEAKTASLVKEFQKLEKQRLDKIIKETDDFTKAQNQSTAAKEKLRKEAEKQQQALIKELAAIDPLSERYDNLKARIQGLQADYRRLTPEQRKSGEAADEYARELRELSQEAINLRPSLEGNERAFGRFSNLASTASSAADRLTGEINELSFANQINAGFARSIENQLFRLGPAGNAAALGLRSANVELSAIPSGGLLATAGLVGVGLAAKELTERGIPEVKAMQNAINILKANGVEDLMEIQMGLRDFAEEGGRAAKQFSRSSLATVLAETVKAGTEADEALLLIRTSVKLAAAEQKDFGTTTENLLTNLRQYNLEVEDAAELGDQFAVASNLARSEAFDLSEGFGTVGSTARSAGIDTSTLLGLLVELDNRGLDPAAQGARGLRTVLATLADPSKKARDTLDELGISLVDNEGKSRDLVDVLDDVRTAIENDEEAVQKAASIFETFGVNVILNLSDAYKGYAQEIREADGALDDYTDTFLSNNLQASQDALNASLDNLAGTFTRTFADDIGAAADQLTRIISNLDALGQRRGAIGLLLGLLRPDSLTQKDSEGLRSTDDILAGLGRTPASSNDTDLRVRAPGTELPAEPIEQDVELNVIIPPLLSEGIPEAVINTFDIAVSKAGELNKALSNAKSPAAYDEAKQALDDFKNASDENQRALTAVNALSKRTTSGSRAASKEGLTLAKVMRDLSLAAQTAQRETAAVGSSLESQIKTTGTLLKATESAFKKALTIPDATTDDLSIIAAQISDLEGRLKSLSKERAIENVFTNIAEKSAQITAELKALGNQEDSLEKSTKARLRLYEASLSTLIAVGAEQSKIDVLSKNVRDLTAELSNIQNTAKIQGVFDDLNKKGAEAQKKAELLGNTAEANIASARARLKLLEGSLDNLISLSAPAEKIDFIQDRIKDLKRELDLLSLDVDANDFIDDLNTLNRLASAAAESAEREAEANRTRADRIVRAYEQLADLQSSFQFIEDGNKDAEKIKELEAATGDFIDSLDELNTKSRATLENQRRQIEENIATARRYGDAMASLNAIQSSFQFVEDGNEQREDLQELEAQIYSFIDSLDALNASADAANDARQRNIDENVERSKRIIDANAQLADIQSSFQFVEDGLAQAKEIRALETASGAFIDTLETLNQKSRVSQERLDRLAFTVGEELSGQLEFSQKKFKALGDEQALYAESIGFTQNAIIRLLAEGFDPESEAVQKLITDLRELMKVQSELSKLSLGEAFEKRGLQSLNSLGPFGSAAATAISGNPAEAGVNLLFDLAEESEEFKQLLELLNRAAEPIVEVLGQLLGAIFPVLEPLLELNAVLLPLIQLVTNILTPVLKILGSVLNVFVDIIFGVWNALAALIRIITFGFVDLRAERPSYGSQASEPLEGGTFGSGGSDPPAQPAVALSSGSSSAPAFTPLAPGTLEAAEMNMAAARTQFAAGESQRAASADFRAGVTQFKDALSRNAFSGANAVRGSNI